MAGTRLSVVAIEADRWMAEALKRWIDAQEGLACRGVAASVLMLAKLLEDAHPDVVVMDVNEGRTCALGAVEDLSETPGSPPVVVLADWADPADVGRALDAGACGFVCKLDELEDLGAAIRCAYRGEVYLSATAVAVLNRVPSAAAGASNEENS